MNLNGKEQAVEGAVNVLSLFGRTRPEDIGIDPLLALMNEIEIEETLVSRVIESKPRKVVNENQFPDQSIYILEEQLAKLQSNINRIKFYLGDLDDLIPR